MAFRSGAITIVLTFLLFFALSSSQAQESDTAKGEERVDILRLQDGNTLRGTITGFDNDSVHIRIIGDRTLIFSRDRVKKVQFDVKVGEAEQKDPAPSPEPKKKEDSLSTDPKGEEKEGPDYYDPSKDPEDFEEVEESEKDEEHEKDEDPWPYHREGYQHHLAQGWFINAGDTRPNLSFLLNPQLYSIHTYRTSPQFAGGIYAGLQMLGDLNTISSGLYNSIGITLNGDLLQNSGFTPFYDIQAGFSHALLQLDNGPYGFFTNIGIGGKAFFGNSKGVSVLGGFQLYRLQSRVRNGWGGGTIIRNELIKGVGLRLTFHL